MEDKIKMKDVTVARQSMTSSQAYPDRNMYNGEQLWDYGTIYSPSGEVLMRSTGYAPEVEFSMKYRGLEFIFRSGYTSDKILVTLDSLMDFVNKEDETSN